MIRMTSLCFVFSLLAMSGFSRDGVTSTTAKVVFESQPFKSQDVDSLAYYQAADGSAKLFATDKIDDVLHILDPLTGKVIGTLGKKGRGIGEFKRPNGVAVAGGYLIVVERDNRRVQLFDPATLKPVKTFGENSLKKPYGVAWVETSAGLELFVTDDYPLGVEGATAAERVKHYRITKDATGAPVVELVRAFGDLEPAGRLGVVESIVADAEKQLLYIADEETKRYKVYGFDGKFTGKTFGGGLIENDPEGLVIVSHPRDEKRKLILITDQGDTVTTWRLFDRDTFTHVGNVSAGSKVAQTDGIAAAPIKAGPFKNGALWAVNADTTVVAFDLGDVLGGI